jgi:predicted ATPase
VEAGLATVQEALAAVEETSERCVEADLYRLRAELWILQSNIVQADEDLQRSIRIARQQQAKSLELRSAASLCRLWQKQGRHQEALQLLDGVYGWFTEGFDTRDMVDARQLLDDLLER